MQRLLVIFDLDETLIHGAESVLDRPCDFMAGDQYFVYRRPYADELISDCLEAFDVAVWTSSTSAYALEVVEHVFPDPHRLKFVWARDRCTWRADRESGTSHWVKNLKKVRAAGYDLDRVLVVDDSGEKLKLQYGNHVPVKPYFGGTQDDELAMLRHYLRMLAPVENVRRVEKRSWHQGIAPG